MAEILLDLKTLIVRDKIKIDEVEYELRNLDELSLLDAEELQVGGQKLQSGKASEMAQWLKRLTSIVIVALPDEVANRLSDTQRIKILEVFMKLSRLAIPGPGERKPMLGRRLRPSKGSTGATPQAG